MSTQMNQPLQSPKKNILIVDDEETITTIIASVLSTTGDYQVETTNDPYEALKRVSHQKYDLFILDVIMPTLSGGMLSLSLESEFGKNKATSQPKFLIISGLFQEKDLERLSHSMNATSYLRKPFDAETLIKKVETILSN
jgi:CheY-like chemotaxis protein